MLLNKGIIIVLKIVRKRVKSMKLIKQGWILVISILILGAYGIVTFPHAFYEKQQTIVIIGIDYTENVMKPSNITRKSYRIENSEEINQLLEILKKYHYRNYLDKQGGFSEPTAELAIQIWYGDSSGDRILLYSDGTLSVNNKLSHIGFVGNSQEKALYQLLYGQYKNKME
jgi:hypothetical protein